MNIQDLKDNVVTETLEFRDKFKVTLKIKPDADVPEGDAATNAQYIAAKLGDWDLTDGGKKLPITKENLEAMPPVLFTAILMKISEVQNAPLGKPTTAA